MDNRCWRSSAKPSHRPRLFGTASLHETGEERAGRPAAPATIRDVASELGMSVATVSRALSQPELLRPETRERVLSVVSKLGYRPNVLARSLSRGQTHAIVLVVPKLSPFFLEIYAGAEEAAQTAGLAVLLGNSDGKPEREEAYFDQVMSGRADGIILLTGLVAIVLCWWQARVAPDGGCAGATAGPRHADRAHRSSRSERGDHASSHRSRPPPHRAHHRHRRTPRARNTDSAATKMRSPPRAFPTTTRWSRRVTSACSPAQTRWSVC